MKKPDRNSDMPVGRLTRVDDFLPSPDKLVAPRESVKITISLSRSSVEFFKEQAKLHNVKYQQMIRMLIDRYASRYSQ